MAFVSVEFQLIPGGLNQLLRSRGGPVGIDLVMRTERTAEAARVAAPVGVVNGGTLRASIEADYRFGASPLGTVVANARHAMWVEEGTGVYNGGGPITPKNGPYMIFSTAYGNYNLPAYGGFYYAESVKGQPGQHYMRRALPAAL